MILDLYDEINNFTFHLTDCVTTLDESKRRNIPLYTALPNVVVLNVLLLSDCLFSVRMQTSL